MELTMQFNPNPKRGSYKPRAKAKLDSHLLLKDDDKAILAELLKTNARGVVEITWDLDNDDSVRQRDRFLQENGLNINTDDVRCKWSTRQSIPTTIVRQCACGSYREQAIGPASRVSVARYPYVGCLAFVKLSLRNGVICAASGYLRHSDQCEASRPQRDPIYRLLPQVKRSVENMLSLGANTAEILAQNARTVKKFFAGCTLLGDYRTLLTATDITNTKIQMLRKNWDIDVSRDAAHNLEKFLGPTAGKSELTEACLHYQAHTKDTDRLEIIICTPEQQQYAWKYGHQNLILLDGTFGISKHKLLLFIMMVIDDNNKGIPITFILFTPPPYNRLTAAGSWRDS